ncbi:hypothetical protein ACVBEH_04995 [Roseateles sp. GG27B]
MSGLSVALALQWLFSESLVKLVNTIKRHTRNALLRQALIGRISWGNALPALNWLEVRK